MKINWKLRLKNKATLMSLIACAIAFIYQFLGILDIVPSISQDDIKILAGLAINALVAVGIVVDPTTHGVGDSDNALEYDKPRKDE